MILVITLALFLGTITPIGYGQAKSSILTKAQVEKLARGRLHIKEDYKLQYSDLYTRDIQQKQFWNLSFEKENSQISVTMEADTGKIISFNSWGNKDYEGVVKLLRDEAKKDCYRFYQVIGKRKV